MKNFSLIFFGHNKRHHIRVYILFFIFNLVDCLQLLAMLMLQRYYTNAILDQKNFIYLKKKCFVLFLNCIKVVLAQLYNKITMLQPSITDHCNTIHTITNDNKHCNIKSPTRFIINAAKKNATKLWFFFVVVVRSFEDEIQGGEQFFIWFC